MISLTRLNGESFTLNAIYIEQIQAHPDTTITLSSGRKLLVREKEEEVITLTKQFYRQIGLASISVQEKEGS
ncbi:MULTISPECIES: flagellar FlbD family protein [Pontibacillus]|uniref:Flagellar FlbD family protein n=1 Tax=Pontibacillus chungwhensis TaxID=265426 RepID=A0ABY8V1W9_9BACI|nr:MULTISPECIES: flagellar FlbD family protein [Pontibacillus]MCD5322690.1 flagellar FlbD family protein [Pontibacillus sp. HN14]WIF99966.1 flagellar FlbD family protein [Pontibacillus chungwhensis]